MSGKHEGNNKNTYVNDPSLKTNWENLCNAVIMQAVRDYRAAYRMRKKHPHDRALQGEIDELERFFHSEHFTLFTDLDGPALLDKLQDMLEEEG